MWYSYSSGVPNFVVHVANKGVITMKLQENMMMFTRAAGIIYGLWFFLAPSSYFALMGVSPEVLSEFGLGQTQQLGLALFVVVWWIYRTATHITQENCVEFMMSHAGGWGIFAVGGMYLAITSGGSIAQNPFFYQSVVFLILAVAFYARRSPQGEAVAG